MDRADCIAREIIQLKETGLFDKVTLCITKDWVEIHPLASPVKISIKDPL